jgi:holo-[acyl-carrier protein] synthase
VPVAHATLSVGIDLVQVTRIADSIVRFGERFVARVYTAAERAYCDAAVSPERERRYAARFAAKEAAWKALGVDDRGHAWNAIEVVRAEGGACAIQLGAALAGVAARPLSLSLTHEADYAAAVVLAERNP